MSLFRIHATRALHHFYSSFVTPTDSHSKFWFYWEEQGHLAGTPWVVSSPPSICTQLLSAHLMVTLSLPSRIVYFIFIILMEYFPLLLSLHWGYSFSSSITLWSSISCSPMATSFLHKHLFCWEGKCNSSWLWSYQERSAFILPLPLYLLFLHPHDRSLSMNRNWSREGNSESLIVRSDGAVTVFILLHLHS